MLVGYARISTHTQSPESQKVALMAAGCPETQIFIDVVSGHASSRPRLKEMLESLSEGDCVVITRLDRLSRSLRDLLKILEQIEEAGASLRALNQSINTSTASGRMMVQMIGVFAEFELALIRERTREGLEAARRNGMRIGRPRALSKAQCEVAKDLLAQGKTQRHVAEVFGVSRATINRMVATWRAEQSSKVL